MPNLVGFKVTDTNLYTAERLLPHLGREQLMYHGADELLSLALMLVVHGGIGTTYNFMPKLILEIASLSAAGRWALTIAAQTRECGDRGTAQRAAHGGDEADSLLAGLDRQPDVRSAVRHALRGRQGGTVRADDFQPQ